MRIMGLVSTTIGILVSCAMRLPRNLEVELHDHLLPESDAIEEEETDDEDGNDDKGRAALGASRKDKNYGSLQLSGSDIFPRKSATRRSNRPFGMLHPSIKALNMSLSQQHLKDSVLHQHLMSRSSSTTSHYHVSFSIAEYASLKQLPIDPSLRSDKILEEETLTLAQTIRTRTTISLIVWQICLSWSLMALYEHFPGFASSIGLSTEEAVGVLSLCGLSMILGNLTLGFVIDRFGPIVVLRGTACVLTSVLFAWPHCKTVLSLRVMVCIYGHCLVIASMPLIILADAFGDAAPSTILFLLGLLNVCSIPGYLIGPTVVGYLYDMHGNYFSGSVFVGVVLFLGIIALMFIPDTKEQKKQLGIQ